MAARGKHSLMCVVICTLVMLAYANGERINGEEERIRNVKDGKSRGRERTEHERVSNGRHDLAIEGTE